MPDELNARYPKLQLELQERISAYWKRNAKLTSMSVKAFGSDMGMVGLLFKATLEWDPADPQLPTSLVIKLPRMGTKSNLVEQLEKETENDLFASNFLDVTHNVEVQVYDIFDSLEFPPVPIARCFMREKMNLDTKRGIIVLEDLSQKAVQLEDLSTSLTVGQLHSIASALADLHSWCITTEIDWKSPFADADERIKKIDNIQPMVSNGLEWLKSNYEKRMIHKDFTPALNRFKPTLPTVLVHGDLWTNNIFFKPNKHGKCSDQLAAIIDWQLVHTGNIFEDLSIILTWCASAEIRRTHSKEIIQQYYKRLVDNVDGKVSLPSEDLLWTAFNEVWPARAILLGGMLQMLLGTAVKLDSPDAKQRTENMVNRALACYDDAMTIIESRKVLQVCCFYLFPKKAFQLLIYNYSNKWGHMLSVKGLLKSKDY
ncbi:Protein NHR-246, isoform a [Trichuris trichiura]|uniref:Protein NHR-246, isoform a n=1 Tax=Trichuris trichiura TaxID=36087 RepID=A0A077Z053_TRITR|nr:Protein NHR-246, isoform a [Trichuris trichiura]